MAITCPGCGNEIREGAAFCDLCHRSLRQEAQPYPRNSQPHPPSGSAGSPPRPPMGQQPMGWTEPPPAPAYPNRYQVAQQRAAAYQGKLVLSTVVLAAAGVIIAVCTFLPFITVDMGIARLSASGWDIYQAAGQVGSNPFFVRFNGIVSVFTGLSSLLLGIVITGLAVAMLVWKRLEISYAIFPAAFIALGVSVINIFNIWKIGPGVGLGTGSVLFLLASIAAIACGIFIRGSLPD